MSGLVEGQINLPQAKERTRSNLYFILLLFPQGKSERYEVQLKDASIFKFFGEVDNDDVA